MLKTDQDAIIALVLPYASGRQMNRLVFISIM